MYSYQYLGVNISYTGNLKQASIDLSWKVTKALFGLNARIKEYSTLNVGTLLKLFDILIQPILTYANEIWISDFKLDLLSDKYPFELVHLKSCKFSLGVHNKTSNLALKCELSRFPILLSIIKLMHGFYNRLNQLPSDRLLHKIFETDKKLFCKGSKSWISCINETEKILGIQNLEKFRKDAFITNWNRLDKSMANIKISSDSKLKLFSHLYNNFTVPYYLNAGMSKAKTIYNIQA